MSEHLCPNCGTAYRAGSNFCNACGEELPDVEPTVSTASGSTSGTPTATGGGQAVAGPDSDTSLAAITHVLGLFTSFLGPLLILLVTDDPFVEQNAKNALNWQIWFVIYATISAILSIVLVGFLFLAVLLIADLLFCVLAAIRASEGEAWEYPLTPALIK